jgi:geranylgeranyl pyrophosphate synthase
MQLEHPDLTVVPLKRSLCPNMFRIDLEKVAAVLRERDFKSVEPSEILSIVDRYNGIPETRALARDYAGAARVALGAFPDSDAKEGLLLATESVIDRIR